jgi:hypothetical protein
MPVESYTTRCRMYFAKDLPYSEPLGALDLLYEALNPRVPDWHIQQLHPSHSTMSSKQDVQISIAVAGLGRMGKRHVRTLLNRVARAQVVAVCSTEPTELAWAQKEYKDWGVKVYDDYAKMIEHPGLQAVWVSTSTDVHASQAIAAIGKGLNVLCEKPLSTDIEEVRKRLYHYPPRL